MFSRRLAVLLLPLSVGACSGKTLDAGTTGVDSSFTAVPSATLATVTASIDAVAMDADTIYFTCEDGWVYRVPKTGSSAAQQVAPYAAKERLRPHGLAVDDEQRVLDVASETD